MPMTRSQQLELRKLLSNIHGGYFHGRASREIPPTKAERAAVVLLKRLETRRNKLAEKYSRQYQKLRETASEAIYFGNDAKAALKKIHALQNFKR